MINRFIRKRGSTNDFNAATEVISPKAIFSINVAIYTSTTTTGLINSCSGRAVN